MKKIVGLIVALLAVHSFAACTVYAPKKVVCRSDDGQVAIYLMGSDNSWKSKIYYPKSEGQTEAVYYRTFKLFDLKGLCVLATAVKAVEDSVKIDPEMAPEIGIDCENKQASFLAKIEKGAEVEIPGFDLALGKMENVSAMYCMGTGYVRTFKYNKITQLETDRQDYTGLKPGTYCQDFLMAKELYWTPSPNDYYRYR